MIHKYVYKNMYRRRSIKCQKPKTVINVSKNTLKLIVNTVCDLIRRQDSIVTPIPTGNSGRAIHHKQITYVVGWTLYVVLNRAPFTHMTLYVLKVHCNHCKRPICERKQNAVSGYTVTRRSRYYDW